METKVIKANAPSEISQAVAQGCQVLKNGGLVAFPTETVYGLAAAADSPGGMERLRQLKRRPPNKPFTLHIGKWSHLERYVPDLSFLERQFLLKGWPGPLTVVFQIDQHRANLINNTLTSDLIETLYHNNSIGIRLPDHGVAEQLLMAVGSPVVAPSANLDGQPPPTNPDDVLQQLAGQIDLLLDAGPTRYNKASTVVRLDGNDIEILRTGVLDQGTIQRMRRLTILFVCTGNTCRSPMAEGFGRSLLAKKLSCPVDKLGEKGYNVTSAGVIACSGVGPTSEAVEVCREVGVDISGHGAGLLTPDLIRQADCVFAMDRSHYRAVVGMVPEAAGRTALLIEDNDIIDPLGGSLGVYRDCAKRIADGVNQRLR